MPTSGVDYNTRTKEQLIELIEMIQRDRYKLEEENKNLKDDLLHYIRREEDYREENNKLKERVKQLEERLDNKEKVNKQLREEIKELNKMMLFETKI